MNKWLILNLSIILCTLLSCTGKVSKTWTQSEQTKAPQYNNIEYWAAHPDKEDPSDLIPEPLKKDELKDYADVFYVYPTIYWQKKSDQLWNAPIDDDELNQRIDDTALKMQASIFNAVGPIYTPRYRQAHINAYGLTNPEASRKAFEIAYQDVKRAFLYYLEHYNNGRPFIIASHSQGTTHSMRLIRELIDGQELSERMVAAYLVGMPVPEFYFTELKPCSYPSETECICSWRTYKENYYPPGHISYMDFISTNPISWTDKDADKTEHKGAILLDFNRLESGICEARNLEGLIWMEKPVFKGSTFFTRKNYHIGDYNLFYLDVRENAVKRARTWIEKSKEMR